MKQCRNLRIKFNVKYVNFGGDCLFKREILTSLINALELHQYMSMTSIIMLVYMFKQCL